MREKKLINNIFIFLAGSVGSKLLQFLLIPFYTNVLSPAEYGTVDVLQTISTLIVPIFSLTISESVFRYAMEKCYDKKEIFSIGLFTTLIGSLLLIISVAIVDKFVNFNLSVWLMVFYSIFVMFRSITSQFLRAIGKVHLFTIDNILQTCGILVCNLFFLLVIELGEVGYLLGYLLGNMISFLFGMFVCGLFRYVEIRKINKYTSMNLYKFSIPLIPNAICWWISSSTDRIMISSFIGTAANGLYSIAHKVPSIITVIVNVFIQAWQISANEEFDKKDTSAFYSKIFELLAFVSFFLSSLLILFVKIEIKVLANARYYTSWKSSVALIVGIAFFSFAQFLGTIYTANKKTGMAFLTNFLAALVNIGGNICLIPKYGEIGAAVATSFSYLVFWVIRMCNTRKIVKLNYNYFQIIGCSILLILQSVFQLLEVRYWIVLGGLCTLGIVAINKKRIDIIINRVVKREDKR